MPFYNKHTVYNMPFGRTLFLRKDNNIVKLTFVFIYKIYTVLKIESVSDIKFKYFFKLYI